MKFKEAHSFTQIYVYLIKVCLVSTMDILYYRNVKWRDHTVSHRYIWYRSIWYQRWAFYITGMLNEGITLFHIDISDIGLFGINDGFLYYRNVKWRESHKCTWSGSICYRWWTCISGFLWRSRWGMLRYRGIN